MKRCQHRGDVTDVKWLGSSIHIEQLTKYVCLRNGWILWITIWITYLRKFGCLINRKYLKFEWFGLISSMDHHGSSWILQICRSSVVTCRYSHQFGGLTWDCLGFATNYPAWETYKKPMERSTMLLMGKVTISMAIFNSYFDITRGYP